MIGRFLLIIHVVKPGDTIYSIAKKYGVPYQRVISDNGISNPNNLVVGQTIVITQNLPKLRDIEVNGYAFPSINMNVLRKTLPDLTYLSIFSHDVRADGTLSDINDRPLINEAYRYKTAPIMVVTNIRSEGGFSSSLAHDILINDEIQNALIDNIIKELRIKNYYGLNIDFEYIYPSDKNNYNNFVSKVARSIKPLGYILITSLAPKTSANQLGLLYEAHDYPFHGRTVDRVVLMTYEWGYTYGPPEAVAPLNKVKVILDYAVTAIPSRKILMGIPNYGYDWTLPYVKGTSAKTLSNIQAVNNAFNVKSDIKYDTKSQAPYYNYYDRNKKQHVVWFEDARSIYQKLLLINQYNLAGASYWTIGRYFPQNSLVLNSLYNIIKVI